MLESNNPETAQVRVTDRELDELIKTCVASYGEPDANSNLAQRILSRLDAESRPAVSLRWVPWAVALPITLCLVLFLLLFHVRPSHQYAGPSRQAHDSRVPRDDGAMRSPGITAPSQVAHERPTLPHRNTVKAEHAAAVSRPQALPKLDVFPTPKPLSSAEQALVQFVEHTPEAERNSLIEEQQRGDAPLTIAAIQIQPLELPDPGKN